MKITSMESCAWLQLYGSFDSYNFSKKRFNEALKRFSAIWSNPPGAVLICAAHGGSAINSPKYAIMRRCEDLLTYIEENGLGYIVEIPEFENHRHHSTIVPYMWVIDKNAIREYGEKYLKNTNDKEWHIDY